MVTYEDYTLTLETEGGTVHSFPVWKNVSVDYPVEMTDKPTQTGLPRSEVIRRLPATMSFSLNLLDGLDDTTKEAQRIALRGLVGLQVTAYTRAVKTGFTGIVRDVSFQDDGRSDSSYTANVEIRQLGSGGKFTDSDLQGAIGVDVIELPSIGGSDFIPVELPPGQEQVQVQVECREFTLSDFHNPTSVYMLTLASDGWVSTGVRLDNLVQERREMLRGEEYRRALISGALLGAAGGTVTIPIPGVGTALGAAAGLGGGIAAAVFNTEEEYVGTDLDSSAMLKFGATVKHDILIFRVDTSVMQDYSDLYQMGREAAVGIKILTSDGHIDAQLLDEKYDDVASRLC